ncbi:hypothetical protein CHS0354_043124 [Potamilus streckersoni]|uniref:Uncharacterized protein n=1 Tax=Potamilus streckersoni TaxID=2493646 RepID=A0AAE0SCT4_9BIVA|nr:hypothetical protein CHS0354_043124 [Potamilus streckersoni]
MSTLISLDFNSCNIHEASAKPDSESLKNTPITGHKPQQQQPPGGINEASVKPDSASLKNTPITRHKPQQQPSGGENY